MRIVSLLKPIIGTVCLSLLVSCNAGQQDVRLDKSVLRDKIAGGWAGKMIGVAYGGPTEFKSLGKIIEDPIPWKPELITRARWEDDLYVQMSFMEVMDRKGMDADAKDYQAALANAGYKLWHANVQARKNYTDSIFPPMSGRPEYNMHADDIDFQIEADFIGMMCPGLPQLANQWSDKIGHIMNYGDGVYGGAFVAALYSAAYVEDNMYDVIEKATLSLPSESAYCQIIKDVLSFYKEYPSDWKKTWQKVQDKWEYTDICCSGIDTNIDAKLNGAYIVIGLLYGEGDVFKTMDISTRCGHDSDCNPSTALGVLGVMKGYDSLPAEYRAVLDNMQDTFFIYTDYTLRKAIDRTMSNIEANVISCGGKVEDDHIEFKAQKPTPLPLEVSFPNAVFDRRFIVREDSTCVTKGDWQTDGNVIYSDQAGDELSFDFDGTGIAICGQWVRNGGKADVYIDGVFNRTIDCYYYYGGQEHKSNYIYHIFNLKNGKHNVKLVVKGEKKPESQGCRIAVTDAAVFHQ